MTIIFDVFLIILLFTIFAVLHSFLASIRVKESIIKKYTAIGAFYRLIYNLFALLSFVFLYSLSPEPDVVIYDFNFPLDLIVVVLQMLSLAGFIWSAFYIDITEFLGFRQIGRYLKGIYDPETLDEVTELNTTGPYKFSRHPLYLFAILFLIFRPAMDLAYLTFLICMTAYFYIGAYYEEKKLVQRYGNQYQKYRESVPFILPLRFIKLN